MIKIFPSLVFILFSCNSATQQVRVEGPPGYDLSRPEVLKMPSGLNEISGITFNAGRPDTIYAEQDEEGRIFYFPSASMDVKHKKFAKKGDYEDIAICNGIGIILRSDGVLFSFPLNATGEEEISQVQEAAGLLPAGEYEGLYADEATRQVYVLCKNCDADKDAKTTSGFILQMTPDNHFELKDNFQLNSNDVAEKLKKKKIFLRPSALSKNQLSNQWYILSSVNKLLVVTNDQWAIQEVYSLDPSLFNQPEGIAFDKDGNLYISNERDLADNATILKFALKK